MGNPEHAVYYHLFHRKKDCFFKQCDNGRCCCSSEIEAVDGEIFEATLWKSHVSLGSNNISINYSGEFI